MFKTYLNSSIGKKQIVAVTGLMLVGFLVFHLSANLMIFLGGDAYNWFPETIRKTGYGLRVLESGLAAVFLIHIVFTIRLVRENRAARPKGYLVSKSSDQRSLATRIMPITGTMLLLFILFHLNDYTLADHHGVQSILDGKHQGVFGVVINSFANPFRAVGYILAMCAVGFHLSHGIQSTFQTFGFERHHLMPMIRKISLTIGLVFAIAFASIPVYFHFIAG